MKKKISTKKSDPDWGCEYLKIEYDPQQIKVKACHVTVSDISKIATALTSEVQNTSWMMSLDKRTLRAYETTADETAKELVKIFQAAADTPGVGSDFGELLVTMSSARALEEIFKHLKLPIAEIWKPQIRQNEGFDFHTICKKDLINFGEAKFSSTENSHGRAINQARDFISQKKHFRDTVHLEKLTPPIVMSNFDDERFGVIAAFSVNSENILLIFKNALESALQSFPEKNIEFVYLIGVSHEHK